MSFTTISIIGICLFLALMFLRMHIGLAMALAGLIGLALIRGIPPTLKISSVITFNTTSSYHLTVLPLFIWMGLLAAYGGVSRDAFSSLDKWIGHLRGGLAMATAGACAAFGAVCGSATATAATMCTAALPEMRRYKYNDELSLGCIAAGGNLGFLIPPSAAFVVYGFLTQTSIGVLFIAGILPGILLTLLFCLAIYVQCRINPTLAPHGSKASWGERLKAFKGIWGIVLIFIIVMGGIYAGVFTPTEAAAVGAFITFLMGIINKQLSRQGFINSVYEAVRSSAMIFLLMVGAMLFGSFLTATEVTLTLGDLISNLALNRYIILAAVLIVYVIGGFFMDIWALLIVSLPITFPIMVDTLGFHPVLFGVLSVLTIMIGGITPPVGMVVFAVHGLVRDVPVFTIFRGCMPFVGAMLVCLAILVAIPQISLYLPGLMLPYSK